MIYFRTLQNIWFWNVQDLNWKATLFCCWGKVTQNLTKAIFFLARKFIFVLYSIKRNQTQRIMEALPSKPFYPKNSSEIKWAVRSWDLSQTHTEVMVPQPGLARARCPVADVHMLGNDCPGVSCFPSLLFPSPIFLLPPLCSSFSIFLLTVQLSTLPASLTPSSHLLSSVFMLNTHP